MARRLGGTDCIVSDPLHAAITQAANESRMAAFLTDPYVARAIVATDGPAYLDATDGGMISYLTNARYRKLAMEGYGAGRLIAASGRQEATAGKALRKIITPEAFSAPIRVTYVRDRTRYTELNPLTDADVETLAVFIQAQFKPMDIFLVTGEAIRYFYFGENYTATERSPLHDSCMKHPQHWNDVRFYAQNPLVIGLLVALGLDGKCKARALVWNGPDGVFMDRVYGNDQAKQAFRRFADKHHWMYRKSDQTGYTEAKGCDFFALPVQQLNMRQKPPYFDTFDLFPYRTTGDMAQAKDHNGRAIGTEDIPDTWTRDSSRNPVAYAALVLKNSRYPVDHPLRKRVDRGRDEAATRDRRVDWLSDFSRLKPWPSDLIRTDPSWTLERWGSDLEDDAANLAVRPERRTEAVTLVRPQPKATDWTIVTLSQGITVDDFRHNVALLDAAFAQIVRGQQAQAPLGLVVAAAQPHDLNLDALGDLFDRAAVGGG